MWTETNLNHNKVCMKHQMVLDKILNWPNAKVSFKQKLRKHNDQTPELSFKQKLRKHNDQTSDLSSHPISQVLIISTKTDPFSNLK